MKDKELRKLIGSRVKQRRLELNLTQPYVAEKMGVTASTILRYENGSIDNTKKMVLEGLSEALHVSVEWLKGETDEYETDITDKRELQIRDAMGDILEQLPLALTKEEDAFSKDLLLLMLKQYGLFLDSFQFACKPMSMNLRSDQTFVEDDGWHQAAERYEKFIQDHKKQKIVFLELGVGYNTPGIIKYPFWQMTNSFQHAFYVCLNQREAYVPEEIRRKSVCMNEDIGEVLKEL